MHENSTRTRLRHARHLHSRRVFVEQRPVSRFVADEHLDRIPERVDNPDVDGVEALECALDDLLRRLESYRAGG
jgi:hypothetical protein